MGHFFTSEVTSLEELISPLSGIRINYEQFSRSSGDQRLAAEFTVEITTRVSNYSSLIRTKRFL